MSNFHWHMTQSCAVWGHDKIAMWFLMYCAHVNQGVG